MDSGALYLIVSLSIVADIVLYGVVARAATGKVGPNAWAGIRTRTTRKNDKTWLAAHVVAYPIMRDTAIANGVLMIVALFVPLQLRVPLISLALGVLVVGVLFAGVQGQKAAKAADSASSK
ncbi:hypothetical protein M2119_001497 [Aurantimicrobium minutum]|uniref:SdpI family protein n=1 Tax=Aurantimicrobium minutum TaxID=708131 RepID=UPI002474B70C|nr:SdpI family protein [Aurantimicrobium minutum]MDH6533260.1 hypothetical protein [Aurantimicrobium minutum]